jgi:hypothetical protein
VGNECNKRMAERVVSGTVIGHRRHKDGKTPGDFTDTAFVFLRKKKT